MIVTVLKTTIETPEGPMIVPDLTGYEWTSWGKVAEDETTMTVELYR